MEHLLGFSKKNLGILFTLVILVSISFSSFSQGFSPSYSQRHVPAGWKNMRHEFSLNLGASNFLGDLGGRDMVGSPFLWDLEFSKTNFAANINYRYYISPNFTYRLGFFYGKVAGDDKLTQEPFRNNRNLNFKSNIFESSLIFEYVFGVNKPGHQYGLRSNKGKKLGTKNYLREFYLFAGIGGFYFNPKGLAPSGNWVDLKPLRTEGQGLPDGPRPYSNFSVAIPVGFGYKHGMGKNWGLNIELSYRFTFTDYIDDVSGVYYDAGALADNFGPLSAQMANPTNNSIPTWADGAYIYNPTGTGMQRGNPDDKDGYMFATLGIYYKMQKTPKRKKSKIKARF
ncbi:MAG: DUF6089 family protein [Flavobacteriales bacterium]